MANDLTNKKSVASKQLVRALEYAGRGSAVLPLFGLNSKRHCACGKGSACTRPGKHPRTLNGVKDATTDAKQIQRWWNKWPHANIGIATGEISGIVALDIDPRNGAAETLKQLIKELGRLPRTVRARTGGGGLHLIYKHPGFPVRSQLIGPGVELKSDSAYVVAPRSRHVSGELYEWVTGRSPGDLEPAELPELWLQRLRDEVQPKPAEGVAGGDDTDFVGEGQRNTYLTSFAGRLRQTGMSSDALLAALLAENQARCKPPLDRSEVEKIANSIATYPAGKALDGDADVAEHVLQLVLDQHFLGGQHLMHYGDKQFWRFDGRKWAPFRQELFDNCVLKTIKTIAHKQNTTSILGQVRTLAHADLASATDCLRFEGVPAPVINCKNGELWIADDGDVALRPHNAKSYLRHCLDVTYDPAAKSPLYDQTIGEIFAKASDPKAMVRAWHDLVGHVLSPWRSIPIIVICPGGGNNGKTKLARTITHLIGHDLVHAGRIESLDKSRFAIGFLLGKVLFLDDDVSAGIRLPDGLLKTISEEKTLIGEIKHGSTFNFINRVVPMLLCNGNPSLTDLSHGLQRRLMVIPFDQTFTPQEDERDRFDKIWAQELPGILNLALGGLKRVVKRGLKFDYPEDVKTATAKFLREANPLPAFIADRCEQHASGRCLMALFYEAYVERAKTMGITMIQQHLSVRRNLEHLNYQITHSNRGQAVIGLRLKTPFEEED